MPTEEQVIGALTTIIDPELGGSIVDLGMVRDVDIRENGDVAVIIALTTSGCPIKNRFQEGVQESVGGIDGVGAVSVEFDVLTQDEKNTLAQRLKRGSLPAGGTAEIEHVVCIAGGKGGVGKSTVAANLAAALASMGHAVGILDCDVYGYSIPRMLGVAESTPAVSSRERIEPPNSPAGVKVMSVGFFVDEGSAVIWRGPMLHKAIRQFLEDVEWGALDYLLLDLPPGTGDVSMTLAEMLPAAKVVVVTTPQLAAQKVAKRAAILAREFDLDIAGVVENMSALDAPDGSIAVFGEGGGQRLADELGVELLAKIPLEQAVGAAFDSGEPIVLHTPKTPAGAAIEQAATRLVDILARSRPKPVPAAEAPDIGGYALPVIQ